MNEHRVAIGNEAVFSRDDASQAPPALIGMDLVRLGLERGRDALGALDVITELLGAEGQGGVGDTDGLAYWSSFMIADPTSAWILETTGRSWAARPVVGGRRHLQPVHPGPRLDPGLTRRPSRDRRRLLEHARPSHRIRRRPPGRRWRLRRVGELRSRGPPWPPCVTTAPGPARRRHRGRSLPTAPVGLSASMPARPSPPRRWWPCSPPTDSARPRPGWLSAVPAPRSTSPFPCPTAAPVVPRCPCRRSWVTPLSGPDWRPCATPSGAIPLPWPPSGTNSPALEEALWAEAADLGSDPGPWASFGLTAGRGLRAALDKLAAAGLPPAGRPAKSDR